MSRTKSIRLIAELQALLNGPDTSDILGQVIAYELKALAMLQAHVQPTAGRSGRDPDPSPALAMVLERFCELQAITHERGDVWARRVEGVLQDALRPGADGIGADPAWVENLRPQALARSTALPFTMPAN